MKSRRLSLFLTFLKIGAFTFGGGYAMIALLEHELIEKKGWIGHDEFLDMAAIAESTPGPVAVNAATYVGFHVAVVSGAALATLAVCLPSFLIIFAISQFFDRFLALTTVGYAFRGIQVCVVYLIASAGWKMVRKLPHRPLDNVILAIVLLAMLACSLLAVSFSSIYFILLSGTAGLCGSCGEAVGSRDPAVLEFSYDRRAVLRRRLRHDLPCAGDRSVQRLADGIGVFELYRRLGVDARPAGREYGHIRRFFAGGLLGRAGRDARRRAAVVPAPAAHRRRAAEPHEIPRR